MLAKNLRSVPTVFKYRLNYCAADGATLVRYDNEKGKGDHKHLGDKQMPYKFNNVDKLLEDFWRDVDAILEKTEDD
jgi:hypothetical protein